MIKAVVWDIGNIFAMWEPEAFYDRRLGEEKRRQFFEDTQPHVMNHAFDLGADGHTLTRAHAEKYPEWAEEIHLWIDAWSEMFSTVVPGSAEIVDALAAKGVKQLALSNFGAETLEIAKEMHPALQRFDEEYVSAHLGVAKPDAGIYEALEAGSGLSGAELIFTDDKQENIDAAQARGWQTHLFVEADGWRARLEAEGLI
ncbi:MAG: HAD-IA family hydrolase [Silicimonas sp.]|nr:HAD-IA family hydrolase [Silicimonas sp.]